MKFIIALIGKAGAGKDTILNQLAQKHSDYNPIVSCTTRPIREGEQEGVNYFYLTDAEFLTKILNGDMLETTVFNSWNYGTMASSLKEGINIGVFNPEGYENITYTQDSNIIVVGVYVKCNDKIRLLRQLNREEHPDVDEVIRRYNADKTDFFNFEAEARNLITVNNETAEDLAQAIAKIERYVNLVKRASSDN